MRHSFMFVIALSIISPTTRAQESQSLQTTMDSNISAMMASLIGALAGKAPLAPENLVVNILPDSQMTQGLISTQILSSENPENLIGTLGLQFQKTSAEIVSLEMKLDLTLSKDLFFKNIETAAGNSIPSPIVDFVELKNKMNQLIEQLEPQQQRPRQTFGAPAPSISTTSNGSALSELSVEILKRVMAEAILVEIQDGSQILTVDLELIKTLLSSSPELADLQKRIDPLVSLRISMNPQIVNVSLVSNLILPSQAIATYDAYFSQLQTNDAARLAEVSSMVSKIAPWLVGQCMVEENQSMCIEKLLSSCVEDVDSLDRCISLAENIQLARDARAEGDYLGVLTNGAEAAATSTIDSIGNSISDWMTSEDDE